MLKENWRLISRLERAGDFLLVVMTFFAAYYGRQSLLFWDSFFSLSLPFQGPDLAPLREYYVILFLSIIYYPLVLSALGGYASMRLSSAFRLFKISLLASFLVFLLLAASLFILKLDLSRSFIGFYCGLVSIGVLAERWIGLKILRFFRRRGRNFRNVLIVGVGEQARKIATQVVTRPELGIRIRAFVTLKPKQETIAWIDYLKSPATHMQSGKVLEGKESVEKALKEYAIDEVIFTDVVSVMEDVEDLVLLCTEQGIETTLAADLFSVGIVRSGLSYFGGVPLIHFETPPGDRWDLSVKRAVDIFVSGILLVILSPLFLIVSVSIFITSGFPVFFKQKRVGLNGRIFSLYKFRSMIKDAEEKLEALYAQNEMKGPVFKMKEDPRITKIGKFIRKHSLDELPQLWNVLRGDMSLVGPRPPIPGEVSLYERKSRRRLSMRPGLTCSWQVEGRNEINDFQSWVSMDLEYIDNWSLGYDFWLLVKTIPVVLLGKGS